MATQHLNGGPVPGVSTMKDWSYCYKPGHNVCTPENPQPGYSAWKECPDAVFTREFYRPNMWGVGENDAMTRLWHCPHCNQDIESRGGPVKTAPETCPEAPRAPVLCRGDSLDL